ncbi:MAG: ATP-binding protein [Polyangiales bacterium]
MIVHDLRNPAATMGANVSFVREVIDDPDLDRVEIGEALADAQQALHDLTRGLDQLSFIGRWINGTQPTNVAVEPLRETFERVRARVKYGSFEIEEPPRDVSVRGGEALERLLELLVSNGHQHAPREIVRMRARLQDDSVVVEVEDRGKPISAELRERAFTLEGQALVKGRADGRYSRVAGLFVASLLAQSIGAQLEPLVRDQVSVFQLRLPRA